jgi:hypothetical protein
MKIAIILLIIPIFLIEAIMILCSLTLYLILLKHGGDDLITEKLIDKL